jgi:hypothetical protein
VDPFGGILSVVVAQDHVQVRLVPFDRIAVGYTRPDARGIPTPANATSAKWNRYQRDDRQSIDSRASEGDETDLLDLGCRGPTLR